MTEAEKLFHRLPEIIPAVKEGKMFGSLCLKTPQGKSAAMLWRNQLVVKLDASEIEQLMKIKGVKYFEPMKGRPMKEWVQIPYVNSDQWEDLVRKSIRFVINQK